MSQHLVVTLDGATILDGQYTAGTVTPPNPVPTPIPGVVMLGTPGNPPAPTPGNPGQIINYQQGVTYAFPWTGGNSCATDTNSGAGSDAQVQLGVAPVAGDWPYAEKTTFTVTPPGGGFPVVYHCISSQSSGGATGLGRPPANTVPAPFYCFFRMVNKGGGMIVQLSLP